MRRVLGAVLLLAQAALAQDPGEDFFEKEVRPVLVERCYRCHAVAKPKGGLRLDSREGMLQGGASGPAIVPGDPERSRLVQAIRWTDDALEMPPKKKLQGGEIAKIEEWIRRGAPFPRALSVAPVSSRHWAFEPVRAPPVPAVQDAKWARDPLDAFVLAGLEAKGLRPAAEGDRRTLLRRASFDLTGLPPTKAEVDAFAGDPSPDAFEKVVDRLLASPRFGERWGRHWLDVARYSDTKGYVFVEERRYAWAYAYRDWVVRAFNEDLPYDRFLVLQIAADRVTCEPRDLAALGFLTLGRRFLNNPPDIIDDRIDVVTRGTMALTASCARCHDHKFDPIPSRDYYSLYGVFASAHEPALGPLLEPNAVPTPESAAFVKELAVREEAVSSYRKKRHAELVADLKTEKKIEAYLEAARDPRDARTVARERDLAAHMLERWRAWLAHASAEELALLASGTAALAKSLVGKRVSALELPLEEVERIFDRKDADKLRELGNRVDELHATHPGAPARAHALEDNPAPFEPHVFVRGNPGNPGEAVPRWFLGVLSKDRKPWPGSGRLELAQAIASRENPLTARVFVNRVLGHLLGAPLVRTPSDFGTRSEPPSNPELLDHLASRFMEDWSAKRLIRSIVLSATYRQSCQGDPRDPENLLLGRANRKRLDFEATRDALLAVSGRLDSTLGGRAVDLGSTRRTLYVFVDRQNLPALFRSFDFATPDAHAPRRFETTVPQQALFFMNSPFVTEAARALAGRAHTVDDLYALVLARAPTQEERELGEEFLAAAPSPRPSPWSYGYGEASSRVTRFTPLPRFTGSAWQGGDALPDKKIGWCLLTANGGHPGGDQRHAVIRRWTSPVEGPIAITGRVAHGQKQGDGIRARIFSSEAGLLGTWTVHDGSADVELFDVQVHRGTTIDLVADCRQNDSYDSFSWTAWLRLPDAEAEWDSQKDFAGPAAPLTAWERYAQVLLETNEFVFED